MKVRPEIDMEQLDVLANELANQVPNAVNPEEREVFLDTPEGGNMHFVYCSPGDWIIETTDVEDARRGDTFIQERIFTRDTDGLHVSSTSSLGYESTHRAGPVNKLRTYLALTCLREQLELQDQ